MRQHPNCVTSRSCLRRCWKGTPQSSAQAYATRVQVGVMRRRAWVLPQAPHPRPRSELILSLGGMEETLRVLRTAVKSTRLYSLGETPFCMLYCRGGIQVSLTHVDHLKTQRSLGGL
jgi:hypothetical protein